MRSERCVADLKVRWFDAKRDTHKIGQGKNIKQLTKHKTEKEGCHWLGLRTLSSFCGRILRKSRLLRTSRASESESRTDTFSSAL